MLLHLCNSVAGHVWSLSDNGRNYNGIQLFACTIDWDFVHCWMRDITARFSGIRQCLTQSGNEKKLMRMSRHKEAYYVHYWKRETFVIPNIYILPKIC